MNQPCPAQVVLGINHALTRPPGPHLPDTIPDWLPGHLHWFIMFDTHDDKSHYRHSMLTQYEDPGWHFGTKDGTSLTMFNILTMVLYGGTPHQAQEKRAIRVVVALALVAVLLVAAVLAVLGLVAKRTARLLKKSA